jgi:hypothetical protein
MHALCIRVYHLLVHMHPMCLFLLLFEQHLVQVHCDMIRSRQQAVIPMQSTIHFVEAAPSILHEMPWIRTKNFKVSVYQNWYNTMDDYI